MNFFEALLLSLALCVDSLVVSTTTAFRANAGGLRQRGSGDLRVFPYRRGLLMALIFGFCQGAFPLAGALIGDVARAFIEAVDHWIAFGLLAFIGGKMIWDGAKSKEDDDASAHLSTFHSPLSTFFLLGTATSIDAFAVGIGLGLDNPLATVLWIVAMIAVVTFIVSLVGVYLGKRNIPVPERTANIIAGVVLIGLGVKILLEHLLG